MPGAAAWGRQGQEHDTQSQQGRHEGPGSQAPSSGSALARVGEAAAGSLRTWLGPGGDLGRQSLWRPHPWGRRRCCWHVGLQTALSPHFRPGRGSCPADSISVGLRLVIGKAHFSQRKDRNRSSGRAESEPENSQDLCLPVRTPSPGLRSAAAGRRQQPGGRSLGPQWPSRRPAPARAFIWCPAFRGCVGLSTAGFQEFPSGGKSVIQGNS